MILNELEIPVVLAPLAGGPSTPELAAAVSNAGGLGFLAAGYLSAPDLRDRIARTRGLTSARFGVNVFVPGAGPTHPAEYERFIERLTEWSRREGVELGEPRYSDDDWEAKIELLARDPLDVVSFTFGCPASELLAVLRAAGSETWVTVTSPAEAVQATEAGAQALVVQGAEAGGHRGSFADRAELPSYSLLPLLGLVRDAVPAPLVASGGIATGAAVAAVIDAHGAEAPVAYPEIHYVTSPMRRRAREDGSADLINLWAGEAHQLADERPAGEIVGRLAADAAAAIRTAQTRLR